MPSKKDDNPQFPERSSGSFLKAAVAATPLTAGVASTMHGVASDGFLKQPHESGIDQAIKVLRPDMQAPPIPNPKAVESFMNKQPGTLSKQAWKWATQGVDPFSRKDLLHFTEGLDLMDEVEVRSAITRTVSDNKSNVVSRVWKRFQTNIDLLKSQEMMSGGLPSFMKVEDLTEFAQRSTVPLATPIPGAFQERITSIGKKVGGVSRIYGLTRPELASEGFGAWNVMFKSQVGDIKVQLPQIAGGVMAEGAELQTKRIAPDVLHIGLDGKITKMSRTEFFLKEMEESVVPDIGGRLKTQRDVDQAVKQLKTKIFGELEAVPNVTIEGRTAAQAQREALRGKAIDILMEKENRRGLSEYQQGFRKPTQAEIAKILESEEGRAIGLRGGTSPANLAAGRLSTAEWERFYIGDVEYGRRPEQPYRGFQVSEESMKALGQWEPNQKYRALQMVGDDIAYTNVAIPKLKATYVNPEMHAALLEQSAMGEGEAIVRANRAKLLEFEGTASKKLFDVRADIGDFSRIKPGEILGSTAEGAPFTLPQDARITGVRRSTEGAVQVDYLQRYRLRHGDKIFGGAKAVTQFRSAEEYGDILRRLQIGDEATDILISMDELKKNRSLHKAQIISSLEDMIRGNWERSRGGAPGEGITRRFFLGEGRAIGQAWAKEAGTHAAFIEKAMGVAVRDMNLGAEEFGRAFGAVPFALGMDPKGEETAQMVARAVSGLDVSRERKIAMGADYWRAIQGGTAGGLADIAYGGPRLEAGVMGSLEPRAFDILRRGPMGKVGEDISAEFAQRLAVTNPEAMIAHEEIRKTLASISRGEMDTAGKARFRSGQSFQQFIEKGGGYISPGKGIPNIYVPGADIMQSMRPFEISPGVQTRGSIADIYHDIAYKAGLLGEGELTPKEFKKELGQTADFLRKEFAPAGKGAGSISRGKVLGSMFLRGVSSMGSADTAIREANVVGITEKAFTKMAGELGETGLYNAAELQAMQKRFTTGGTVSGMLARHPFIGEYSLQPVQMRMVEGSDDLIVLPEIRKNVKYTAGGKTGEKALTLGPLVGLAGDKDADAYSAMLVGPRNEEKLRKQILINDSEFANRYAQHQIRMKMFKASAPTEAGLTTLKQMMADVGKLGVGQQWIAPLSLEMSSASRALTMYGKGQEAADARFLLEWLEQTPISAKHLKASEVRGGAFEASMQSIVSSLQDRKAARLEGNIASIIKDDATAKALLVGNVDLDPASAREISNTLGIKLDPRLKQLDVKGATREIQRVLEESDKTGQTRMAELLAGRGERAKMNEIRDLSMRGAFFGAPDGAGMFSKISTGINNASNRLGQVGRGIIKHHKAIGLGFAGSIALSSILSSPPEIVGSGASKIPDGRLYMNRRKAADRMVPENLHPPGQSVGQPTAPQLVRNQTVRMAMNQPRQTNMRTSARLPRNANVPVITSSLGSLGNNTVVNLRDSRTTLSPHEVANKLL